MAAIPDADVRALRELEMRVYRLLVDLPLVYEPAARRLHVRGLEAAGWVLAELQSTREREAEGTLSSIWRALAELADETAPPAVET
jgi:hypothetical protein